MAVLRADALRLEPTPALRARAEECVRGRRIPRPADAPLRRLVGERREQAAPPRPYASDGPHAPREARAPRYGAAGRGSPALTPPGPEGATRLARPRALLQWTDRLEQRQATQGLTLDLSWLTNNLPQVFARQAWPASAHRLRGLPAPHRVPGLVCFLRRTPRDTLAQLVDMDSKRMTAMDRRAPHDLDEAVKRHRPTLRATLQSGHPSGQTLWDGQVPPAAVRAMISHRIPPERLPVQRQEAHQWLTGDTRDVCPWVMKRYSSLHPFAPSLLDPLMADLEPTGSPALREALTIVRDLNTTGRRTLPLACILRHLRPFVGPHGTRNRRAYECAGLTALRNDITRGKVGGRAVGAWARSRMSSYLTPSGGSAGRTSSATLDFP